MLKRKKKVMKKFTVRLDDYIYDRLNLVAKDSRVSINKIIGVIVEKYIYESNEVNYLKEIDNKLKMLSDKLESISKNQHKHIKISKQHFANVGYLSNADINEDKCLKEILEYKDKFND